MNRVSIFRADGVRLDVGAKVVVANSEDGFARNVIGIIVYIDDQECPVGVAPEGSRERWYFKPTELELWHG